MLTKTYIQKIVQLIVSGDISYLLTDSRSLCVPEHTVFFALKTPYGDGHRYVDELFTRGVRYFVVDTKDDDLLHHWAACCVDATFWQVDNTLEALQKVVTQHRQRFHIPVVGITGSNGKTIVKEWICQLTASDMAITRSPRSYNSQVGVPLSVFLLNEHTQAGLFEAGISKVGEMANIAPIIAPTIGVFTNIGNAHKENFDTIELKLEEKLQLFATAETIVYCADDPLVQQNIEQRYGARTLLGWSMQKEDAPVYVDGMQRDAESTRCICHLQHPLLPEGEVKLCIPFTDDASLQNAVNAFITALLLGTSLTDAAQRVTTLEPVAMRLEVKEGRNGCTIINDSYNSDLVSLDIALNFMQRRTDAYRRHTTLVLSDFDQMGHEPSLYEKAARMIQQRNVDRIITIGPNLAKYKDVFAPTETHTFMRTNDFFVSSMFRSLHDEIVLLKGARRFRFERLAEHLAEKVHETTLEVDLTALVNNLNHYRAQLRPSTRLMCMIKAGAYGTGPVEVAKTLAEHHVDYLAVAVADEGVTLREQGIATNIVVMNPEINALRTLFDHRLQPEVYSFRILDALLAEGSREGMVNFPIHIKIDTGMHRLGFHPTKDLPRLIAKLKHQRTLLPRSVFTHFAGADDDVFDTYSAEQYALFMKVADELQVAFPHRILRHVNNTAGIEHFPDRQLDMCRLGLGLYGVSPRGSKQLSNVSTLRTTILQIHDYQAGETIGYSRRTTLERYSRIAAIPIGYADGLNRKFGNRNAYCIVNGQQAPYVGNICMDVSMIDVTDIDCKEGDSVEIFGPHLPVTRLSAIAQTIPYEVMTGVSNRVKRVFFRE